jgi:hypothetical protein
MRGASSGFSVTSSGVPRATMLFGWATMRRTKPSAPARTCASCGTQITPSARVQ